MEKPEIFASAIKAVPIKSLEELKLWKPITNQTRLKTIGNKHFSIFNSVDGKFTEHCGKTLPKTLVCHDMKGGYLDDSFIHGSSNSKAYCFTQWNFIDIFVYFSHHFVTIPPPCWVHAAHLHGVPILGTIITEWDEGAAMCDKIFSSKESVDEFVRTLTELSLHHNCDGWLINIENLIREEQIDNIIYFLRRLKRELTFAGNIGKIIWYDSVTKEGKLSWQNELNEFNRAFFDACDGIFINYTWKIENLKTSIDFAGMRTLDVFVGIDVFGRNCYGGGGFNTVDALSVVRQHRLSAAIFAPGWTYECLPIEEFPEANSKFWSLLLPYLHFHGPCSLPIRTSFCPGYGEGKYEFGMRVENAPWHNGLSQQLQPLLASVNGLENSENNTNAFEVLKCGSNVPFGRQELSTTEAFHGGGCLKIQSSNGAIFPLFVCELSIMHTLSFVVVFRVSEHSQFGIRLGFQQTESNRELSIFCPITLNENFYRRILYDKHGYFIEMYNADDFQECELIIGNRINSPTIKDLGWEISFFRVTIQKKPEDLLLRFISAECLRKTEGKIGYLACF